MNTNNPIATNTATANEHHLLDHVLHHASMRLLTCTNDCAHFVKLVADLDDIQWVTNLLDEVAECCRCVRDELVLLMVDFDDQLRDSHDGARLAAVVSILEDYERRILLAINVMQRSMNRVDDPADCVRTCQSLALETLAHPSFIRLEDPDAGCDCHSAHEPQAVGIWTEEFPDDALLFSLFPTEELITPLDCCDDMNAGGDKIASYGGGIN